MRRPSLALCVGALLFLGCEDPPPPAPPPPPDLAAATAEWAKTAALPLASVEPGHAPEDLSPVTAALGDARVVALGEATHGAREFFQLKHRLLRHLVQARGFTVFAMEANFGESLALDEYVQSGTGSPTEALKNLQLWPWNTEEVLALVEWMRAYNADPVHTRKLKFYGFDAQYSMASASVLLDFLAEVDPAYRDEVSPWLTPLLKTYPWQSIQPADRQQEAAELALKVEALRQRLADEHIAYAAASGEDAWTWAVQHARALAQFASIRRESDAAAFIARDIAMADNVRWILEREGSDARMVLWAHNSHVARGAPPAPNMGTNLATGLGAGLYSFGFVFNQGQFRAWSVPDSGPGSVATFTVPPAPKESLDATLALVGLPLFALDLRSAPLEGPVHDFLNSRRPTRESGGGYSDTTPMVNVVAARRYDGLLFVDTTSPSQPLQSVAGAALLHYHSR